MSKVVGISRSVLDVSRKLSGLNLIKNAPSPRLVLQQEDFKIKTLTSFNLSKNNDIQLTANYWANEIKPKIEIIDPLSKTPIGHEIPKGIGNIAPGTVTNNAPLEDPILNMIIEKKSET